MANDSNEPAPRPTTAVTGFTILVDCPEPRLDIVFVHGFTGHPERTWTHKRGDLRPRNDGDHEDAEPVSKIRKLNPFSKSQDEHRTSCFWPYDLLPSFVPNARILTYGYDTHVRHVLGSPGSQSTVYDIAGDCLVQLEAHRRADPSRPVLFVVHSLGGIVVKEMLRRSDGYRRDQPHLREVFNSTVGIMFFGTPHGGADPRGLLQHIAEKAIKAAGFSVNEQIVNTLLPSAERLRELRDEFGPMAQEQRWIIHSFQEQIGVGALSGRKDTSSYLNIPTIEVTEHIGRNHMEMCRFSGREDIEYRKVCSALDRMTSRLAQLPQPTSEKKLSAEQMQMLLDSLRFEQIDARHLAIKKAYRKTCRWLLNRPEYLDWLSTQKTSEHHGFLWIKGKPGAGKSTLMKFALSEARRTMKGSVIISFFFNARGTELEKSTIGMYRSLLLQLLEKLPQLQVAFESLELSTHRCIDIHEWTMASLKTVFEDTILKLGSSTVVCFVDALDECDAKEIRDMISFFEFLSERSVSSGVAFSICFSSRHYPYITVRKGLSLIIEGQEGHSQDINNFLEGELKIGNSKTAEEVRNDVQQKASGVFIWVILVVDILNEEFENGRIHAIRERLREIPSDLHELFRSILTRDSQNRNELFLCLQWILFARRPLHPQELYYAIISGTRPQTLSKRNPKDATPQMIERFILGSSKGLAEITNSKNQRVQFIHESVNDFLLKENGLAQIWPEFEQGFHGQSHDQLKKCCLNYIAIDVPSPTDRSDDDIGVMFREELMSSFPLLQYAVLNLIHHADQAQCNGVPQEQFMLHFPLERWIRLSNSIEKFKIRRHTDRVSLLYILAENNAASLISIHPKRSYFLEMEEERHGSPLFAALATNSFDAVRSLIPLGWTIMEESISQQEYWQELKNVRLGRSFDGSYPVCRAAEYGSKILVSLLLQSKKFSVHEREKNGMTPILYAIANEDTAMIELLLAEDEFNLNFATECGTPLIRAIGTQNEAIIRLLLSDPRIDPNLSAEYRTPLICAVETQNEAIIRILLSDARIDPNLSAKWRTPLICAVETQNEAIIRLLLSDPRVDPNLTTEYQTPLLYAVGTQNEAIIRILLSDARIDPNLSAKWLRPLICAVETQNEATIRILLSDSRVDPNLTTEYRTPLIRAVSTQNDAIVRLLLSDARIDPNARGRSTRTPLTHAVRIMSEAMVRLLLSYETVDPNIADGLGITPLRHAHNNGFEEIVRLLVSGGELI